MNVRKLTGVEIVSLIWFISFIIFLAICLAALITWVVVGYLPALSIRSLVASGLITVVLFVSVFIVITRTKK